MVNVNAQEWLNDKYPLNGACQRKSDQKNKNKTRAEITELDISKGNLGKHFYSTGDGDKNLVGSLKLEGFTNLWTLIVSSHQITRLDVSDCPNLKELDCRSNQLNSLNVSNYPNLKKIDCSNNSIKELDLSTCISLEEVDINGCSEFNRDTIKANLNYDKLSGNLVKGKPQITPVGENDIRNILIVGITGNGKSALSNVLTNTKNFKESSASASKTKNFQRSDVFEWQGRKYRVVDNIGFGDTNNITEEEILFRIGEGIHEAEEGINQILFLFKDRFSPEHIAVFNSFEKFVAKSGIVGFTTLIRTNFENFRVQQECKDDKESLFNQNNELDKIIKKCKGVIHVDNPPVPTIKDEDDDEERQEKEQKIRSNEKIRTRSRKKVLDHLAENCQEIYKLKSWDNISLMVEDYNKKKAEVEKNSSSTKEEQLRTARSEVAEGVKRELEANIGVNIPGLPFGFNLGFKYNKTS